MTSDLAALVERLRNCNPPDRTIDEQRPVAQLIVDAAAAIESLAAENLTTRSARTLLDGITARAERAEADGKAAFDLSVECRARAVRAEAERDALRQELQNIANARPQDWEPEVRDQFQQWAQNRARAAIDAVIAQERRRAIGASTEAKASDKL